MTTEQIPQGKLKILDISDIKWEKRYRVELGDVETLAESIREKGILQPITVDTNYNLLAGERRVTAAKIAGLTKIPALVRDVEGEIDAREVELLENVARKDFTWDEEATLIRDIDALYKAKSMEWSGRKTAQLLDKGVASVARAIQLANAIDVIPELGDMKTADEALKTVRKMEEQAIVHELRARQQNPENIGLKGGIADTLKLADKNYQIGDTFLGMAALRSNGNIHLIECDPPYGISLGSVKAGQKDDSSSDVQSYHEVPTDEYEQFLHKLAHELYRVANPNAWLVFWYGPTWHTQVMFALRDAGWLVDDIPCIWTKGTGQTLQPEVYLARTYEPFLLCRKGHPVLVKRGRSNVFDFSPVSGASKYHPTQRPTELIEEVLETLAIPGQHVFVPFLGSGATIRSCYNLGLKVSGWDLNPEYKDNFLLKVEADARALLAMEELDDGDEL